MVAVKKANKASADAHRLPEQLGEWEVNLMLKHKNIVEFLGYWFEENDNCMVFEYCNAGDLHRYLRRNTYRATKEDVDLIFPQILRGVAHMHQHDIVHRDIKPENILLVKPDVLPLEVKLSDFGCAYPCRPHQAVKAMGTFTCRSPEMLLWGGNWSGDMWALGLVLWDLMFEDPLMSMHRYPLLDPDSCLEFIRGSFFTEEVSVHIAEAKEFFFPYHALLASLLELQWQQRPIAVDALAFCSQSFQSADAGGQIPEHFFTELETVHHGSGPPSYVPHPWLVEYHAEEKQFVYYREDTPQEATFAPPPCAPMPWDVRWCNKTKRFYRGLHSAFERDNWNKFDEFLYGGQQLKEKVQFARRMVDPNLYFSNIKEWEALINQLLLEDHDGGDSLTGEEEEEASIVADSFIRQMVEDTHLYDTIKELQPFIDLYSDELWTSLMTTMEAAKAAYFLLEEKASSVCGSCNESIKIKSSSCGTAFVR